MLTTPCVGGGLQAMHSFSWARRRTTGENDRCVRNLTACEQFFRLLLSRVSRLQVLKNCLLEELLAISIQTNLDLA